MITVYVPSQEMTSQLGPKGECSWSTKGSEKKGGQERRVERKQGLE